MVRKSKGGKIIGLAKDERGEFTKEVSAGDERAKQWFDTNTYKLVPKPAELAENRLTTSPVAQGSPTKAPRSMSGDAAGGRRRKTRRGKKNRRITRKL